MKIHALILAALLAPFGAHAAPFDCKPSQLPNGVGQGGEAFTRMNLIGGVAAWRCKTGQLNIAVVRWDWAPERLSTQWGYFFRDPSFQRMNEMLAANQTADWRTDPKLMEVWLPYKAQIEALKP